MVNSARSDLRRVEILKGINIGKIGFFHGFFQAGDNDGFGPEAVIELEYGNVVTVYAESIKFTDAIC